MDWSQPGSSVHGISQARTLEWVVISFSRGSSWPRDQASISCIGRQILYPWATKEAHTHTYISSFWISFPFKSPQSRVPCAIQEVLVSYLCLTQWRIYINPNVTIHPSAFFSLGVQTFVLYIPVSISALQIRSSVPFFLDYTYKWHHIYVLSNHVKTDGKNHLQAKEKALRMKPTLPIPWPWTSKCQDCEKMHFLKLFKTPSLWYFVMAQLAN